MMVVDTRERTTPFYNSFTSRFKVEATFEAMPFDYLFPLDGKALAVERKEINDFANSLYTGRIYEQVKGALNVESDVPVRYMVLVHGSLYEHTRIRKGNPYAFLSALTGLMLGFGISVLLLPNTTYAHMFLHSAYKRTTGYKPQVTIRTGRKGGSTREKAVYFLCGLPHVGVTTANKLLEKYTTRQAIDALYNGVLSENYTREIREVLDYPPSPNRVNKSGSNDNDNEQTRT